MAEGKDRAIVVLAIGDKVANRLLESGFDIHHASAWPCRSLLATDILIRIRARERFYQTFKNFSRIDCAT